MVPVLRILRSVNPKAEELQTRTRRFLTRVIRFCESLPKTQAAVMISGQLTRSAGGTDSNYRGACRARSRKEFIAKIGVCAEEADESLGWLKAMTESEIGEPRERQALSDEADELTAIFVASEKTAKRKR